MRSPNHCRAVSLRSDLPMYAQDDGGDTDSPFDLLCAEDGPRSALEVKLCGIDALFTVVIQAQRAVAFNK